MELASGVLLVCAILDIILFASVFSAHHESREIVPIENGIPLLKYEYCNSLAPNAVKCFQRMCGSQGQKCTIIAYNQATRECLSMKLNSHLIFFARKRLIEEGVGTASWRTLYMRVRAFSEHPEPIGLWHFGHITQGMNLGNVGAMLDVGMTKDSLGGYYSWKHKFLKNSTLERFLLLSGSDANLYARFSMKGLQQIYMFFSNGVTFGAWILMSLEKYLLAWQELITIKIEGVGNANLTFKIINDRIYYKGDWKYVNRLAVVYRNASGVPVQLHSKELPEGGMKWRHFAVTVNKTGTAHFFLNGETLSWSQGSLFGGYKPKTVEFLPYYMDPIDSGMACAAFYNGAISATQVKTLMELCP